MEFDREPNEVAGEIKGSSILFPAVGMKILGKGRLSVDTGLAKERCSVLSLNDSPS